MSSSVTEKKHYAETGRCRICGWERNWTILNRRELAETKAEINRLKG